MSQPFLVRLDNRENHLFGYVSSFGSFGKNVYEYYDFNSITQKQASQAEISKLHGKCENRTNESGKKSCM